MCYCMPFFIQIILTIFMKRSSVWEATSCIATLEIPNIFLIPRVHDHVRSGLQVVPVLSHMDQGHLPHSLSQTFLRRKYLRSMEGWESSSCGSTLQAGQPSFRFIQRHQIPVLTMCRLAIGSTQSTMQWMPGLVFLWCWNCVAVKPITLPFVARAQNDGAVSPLPLTVVFN